MSKSLFQIVRLVIEVKTSPSLVPNSKIKMVKLVSAMSSHTHRVDFVVEVKLGGLKVPYGRLDVLVVRVVLQFLQVLNRKSK